MSGENPVVALGVKGYELLIKLCDLIRHPLLLLFRINWGLQFFHTGIGKLKNHNDIVSFFKDLGIPLPDLNAWLVGGFECVGGILLLIGFMSRPVAAVLTVTMVVAYLSVTDDRQTVINFFQHFVSDTDKQNPFLRADPFFFLLTSLLVLAFGPGIFSLDYLLGRFVFKKRQADGAEETSSSEPV